jgi:gamma-glutamyltranspeptidase / glutathione hydrolase
MTIRRAMPATIRLAIGLLSLAVLSVPAAAGRDAADAANVVRAQNGAVVSVNAYATQTGVRTLQRGGSAVDAAVATAFALAVTYPVAGNIGGGGYLLVVPADGTGSIVVDFRETAPAAATRDMFVDPADRTPHRRVGVPGTVRGLELAHKRFGKLPWRELVLPAVRLAREGFQLDAAVATELNKVLAGSDKKQFAALHATFGRADGRPWRSGDRLVQTELAEVLNRIADEGADGFYTGPVAELIAKEMQKGGGLITQADLAAYRPIVREPVRSTYRGCEILAVPPSSSGGTTLAEELNILETFDLRSRGRWSAETLHLVIESMRRAFRDRAAYLGDPAMTKIPAKLLDKQYARQLAATIDPNRATPSVELAGDIKITTESEQTTHLSLIDRERTAVSLTYTLESGWGSRVVVPGGGFLLNDEMNDFNWLPGVTNTSGRIGTPPNDVAPGKRMLSSMCPVVVRRDGRPLLVTGSPGGRTIINTVLCMVVNVVDFDMDIRAAVDAPRLHHGWFPDRVRIEPGLPEDHAAVIEQLRGMGHHFGPEPLRQGDAQSIWIDPETNEIVAAADRRISGSAAGY